MKGWGALQRCGATAGAQQCIVLAGRDRHPAPPPASCGRAGWLHAPTHPPPCAWRQCARQQTSPRSGAPGLPAAARRARCCRGCIRQTPDAPGGGRKAGTERQMSEGDTGELSASTAVFCGRPPGAPACGPHLGCAQRQLPLLLVRLEGRDDVGNRPLQHAAEGRQSRCAGRHGAQPGMRLFSCRQHAIQTEVLQQPMRAAQT